MPGEIDDVVGPHGISMPERARGSQHRCVLGPAAMGSMELRGREQPVRGNPDGLRQAANLLDEGLEEGMNLALGQIDAIVAAYPESSAPASHPVATHRDADRGVRGRIDRAERGSFDERPEPRPDALREPWRPVGASIDPESIVAIVRPRGKGVMPSPWTRGRRCPSGGCTERGGRWSWGSNAPDRSAEPGRRIRLLGPCGSSGLRAYDARPPSARRGHDRVLRGGCDACSAAAGRGIRTHRHRPGRHRRPRGSVSAEDPPEFVTELGSAGPGPGSSRATILDPSDGALRVRTYWSFDDPGPERSEVLRASA